MSSVKSRYVNKELLERQVNITKAVTYATAGLVLLMAYVCYFYAGIKEYLHFFLIPYSIIVVINIQLFKWHKKLFYVYMVLICLAYIEVVGIACITGGLKSDFLFILAALPINASITSKKQGIYWSVISLLTIVILFALEKAGVQFPNIVPEAYVSTFNFVINMFVLIVISMLSIIMAKSSFKIYKAKDEISNIKNILELKNNQILDSISYAKRIQDASLPTDEYLRSVFDEYFVYYQPKDIVSGDFYWVHHENNKKIWIAADCTGHGVPGAFMSLIGMLLLNDMVVGKKIYDPKDIAELLSKWITQLLEQNGSTDEETTKDGMDIMICTLDETTNELKVCGAYNSLYLIRDNQLQEFKGAKRAIGYNHYKKTEESFITHTIQLQQGDLLYSFTDGYIDQKGGPEGKKFYSKRFKEHLINIAAKSMKDQKKILVETMNEWKKDQDQMDDMLIFGVKIS